MTNAVNRALLGSCLGLAAACSEHPPEPSSSLTAAATDAAPVDTLPTTDARSIAMSRSVSHTDCVYPKACPGAFPGPDLAPVMVGMPRL